MSPIGLILVILLIMLIFGGGYWGNWPGRFGAGPYGYYGGGLVLVIIVILIIALVRPF